jgi:ribosomal protein S12 methylthiotransferase accessory factor YcaO
MAVGLTVRAAIVAGLQESVERAGVAAMSHEAPTWRVRADNLSGPFIAALTRHGWSVDVVGCGYAGFAVAICVASHDKYLCSLGGAAARLTVDGAVEAAVAEAYMKSTAFQNISRAITATVEFLATEELWHDLPSPERNHISTLDPIESMRQSGRDAAVVNRGNALLDAIGWCAAHVVLLDEATAPGPLFARLLR